MSAFYGWMCLTYSLHPVYHFLIEATHPCKPASFLCTVHALYCSLQTTVCLRAVWVLAVSYWRGVDVPRGAGEAIMMIFTMSDNECQGNPRLGPRSNTQTNKHTPCLHTLMNKMPPWNTHTHIHLHPGTPDTACVLSVWVLSLQGNQRHPILPRGVELEAPQKPFMLILTLLLHLLLLLFFLS